METDAIRQFYDEVERELFGNIIPFWLDKTQDTENGGFYGRILNNLSIERGAPKSLILNARILWTFSALFKFRENEAYLHMARRASDYLKNYFYDPQFGGVFWLVDSTGKVIDDKKRIYGQAFMIYALAEFYSATKHRNVLDEAISIYNLIEKHNYDKKHLGYLETSNRNWTIAEEMRLSEVDMNEMKSMNTHLHLMEAYAALYSVWPDSNLKQKLTELIHDFEAYINCFLMKTGTQNPMRFLLGTISKGAGCCAKLLNYWMIPVFSIGFVKQRLKWHELQLPKD